MSPFRSLAAIAAFAVLAPSAVTAATLRIDMTLRESGSYQDGWTGNTTQLTPFSARQVDLLGMATSFWQTVLTGFQGRDAVVAVTASMASIDGSGRVAAYAGPRTGEWIQGAEPMTGASKRFLRAKSGIVHFDAADFGASAARPLSDDMFLTTAIHELSHIFGYGTIMKQNGLVDASDRYVGLAAVDAFNRQNGTSVGSILLDEGTGHWSECWVAEATGKACTDGRGGSALTTNHPDVLTPILPRSGATMTAASIAMFRDLGFDTIDPATRIAFPTASATAAPPPAVAPVPLPAGGLLLLTGLGAIAATGRHGSSGRRGRSSSVEAHPVVGT